MSIEIWELSSSRSRIRFAVRHFVVSKTRGSFNRWHGTLTIPDGDITRASVEVVIDASSIDTGVPKRDAHLRRADYFGVERHPAITFTASNVSVEPDGRLRVIGALTLKGVTREVTLAVEPEGHTRDSLGSDRARFLAKTAIHRRDFGFAGIPALDAGGMVIGERIDIEIDVEAVRRSVARAA